MNPIEIQLLVKVEIQKIDIQLNQLKRKEKDTLEQAYKALKSLKKLTMDSYLKTDFYYLSQLYTSFLSETEVVEYINIRQKFLNQVAEIKQTTKCYEFQNDLRYRQLKVLYQNTVQRRMETEYEHYQSIGQEQPLEKERIASLMIQRKNLSKLLYKLEHVTEKNITELNAQLEQNQFPLITTLDRLQIVSKRKQSEIDKPIEFQTVVSSVEPETNTIILLPSSPYKSYIQNDINKFTEEQLLDLNGLIEQIIHNHFSHNKQQHKKFTEQIFVMKKGTLRLFYTQWEKRCYVLLYCQIKKTQRINDILKRLHRRSLPLSKLKKQIPNPLEDGEFMKQQEVICKELKQKLLSKKITRNP